MRKSMKLMCVAAVIFGLGAALSANPVDYENSVGMSVFTNFQAATGGIEYQHWFNKVGVSGCGLVNYAPQDVTTSSGFIVDVQVDYKLFESKISNNFATRLTVFGLAGVYGDDGRVYDYDTRTSSSDGFFLDGVFGLGIGFDLMAFEHLSFPLKAGYILEFPHNTTMGFACGTGIRYVF